MPFQLNNNHNGKIDNVNELFIELPEHRLKYPRVRSTCLTDG